MLFHESQLKEFLLDTDLISKSELLEAEKKALGGNISLAGCLLSSGKISDDDLRRVIAHVAGIPFISLKNQDISFETISLIPEPVGRVHNVVAYRQNGRDIEVALLSLDDLPDISFLEDKEGLQILPRLTDRTSITAALLQYQKYLKTHFGEDLEREISLIKEKGEGEDDSSLESKKIINDLSAVRFTETLLRHALKARASDVHIDPTEKGIEIRYRINGVLRDAIRLPKEAIPFLVSRIKTLSHLDMVSSLPQDGRFQIRLEKESVGVRVSVVPVYYGEKIVLRLLGESSRGFSLESLGFHGEGLEKVHHALHNPKGLILISGPKESGKTTVLYTFLDLLNIPEKSVVTLEDPIEYHLPRIHQTEVNKKNGFTVSVGLPALLKQDPDVIMVSEIDSSETLALLMGSVQTGRLVLSSLTASDAVHGLEHLLKISHDPLSVSFLTRLVVSGRVLRKLHPVREKYFLSSDDLKHFGKVIDLKKVLSLLKKEGVVSSDAQWSIIPFYRPQSTSEAPDGYQGHVAVFETLLVTDSLRGLLIKGASFKELQGQAVKEGMITLIEEGIYRAVRGETSLEEVFRVIHGI